MQFGAATLTFTLSATRVLVISLPQLSNRASGPALENDDSIIIQRCEFATEMDSSTGRDAGAGAP